MARTKRGLASADVATRQRVASMGGKAHDQSFYSEIGRKGGLVKGKKKQKLQPPAADFWGYDF